MKPPAVSLIDNFYYRVCNFTRKHGRATCKDHACRYNDGNEPECRGCVVFVYGELRNDETKRLNSAMNIIKEVSDETS